MPRSLRRAAALLLLVCLALFAAACGGDDGSGDTGGGDAGGSESGDGGEDTGAESAGEPIQVGLVQINQQAIFFNQMNEGAQAAADELGVDLTIFNANDDPVQQNEAIDNFVQQQFDAIIVVAIDVEGVKPAIEAAKDAGVSIIAVDAIVDSPAVDVQVGVDNADAAGQIGEFVNEWAADAGVEPQIGVVGALNSFIQNIRGDEFVATVEDAGATIVQTVDGENVQESALAAAENLFTAHADMNVVYATGEPALLGTVAAARSQGRTEDVAVFGWDLTSEIIQGIDDGFVLGVVQQDPRTEGVEAVTAAQALADGEEVEAQIDVPIEIVTSDNVDPYRPIFE